MNEAPDNNVARRGKYSSLLTRIAVTGGFVQNCTLSQSSLVRGNDGLARFSAGVAVYGRPLACFFHNS
jgi:hypothetical protein